MASPLTIAIMEFLSTSAAKMFLSICLGYPLAFIYRFLFARTAAIYQHTYFILCGILLLLFNFGINSIHSAITIILMYLLLQLNGGTKTSVALAFAINMGYLLAGYYNNSTLNYSITWTTPQCVLCLRLIGLVYDVYDGSQDFESLSAEQKENCLPYKPSLVQMFGYCYFFGGSLAGPQFSMRRYMEMVNGTYLPDKLTFKMLSYVFNNLLLGVFYITVYQVTQIYFPDTILISEYFESSGFFFKCLLIMIWSKFMLYKYIGCWHITEGSCLLCGLGYTPVSPAKSVVYRIDATGLSSDEVVLDEEGSKLPEDVTPVRLCHEVCSNVDAYRYETACTCHQLVQSFNTNTNKWMARYVFKRCKSLGNRNASHIITLAFLAIWHGFYSGYFVNFLIEFFVVRFENDLGKISFMRRVEGSFQRLGGVGEFMLYAVKKLHVQFILGYALVSFNLFTFPRYMHVYSGVYYCIFISHFLLWPVISLFIKKDLKTQ